MIEYGVPILFLFTVFVGVPVGLGVAVFFVARGVARWWLRRTVRFVVQERVRAERELTVSHR